MRHSLLYSDLNLFAKIIFAETSQPCNLLIQAYYEPKDLGRAPGSGGVCHCDLNLPVCAEVCDPAQHC